MTDHRRRGPSRLAYLLGFAFLAATEPAFSQQAPGADDTGAPPPATPVDPVTTEAPAGDPAATTPTDPVPPKSSAKKTEDLLGIQGGLTSDEAAKAAAVYTKDADIAKADQEIADARKDQTIYNYAPRVTLTASYTRQSVPEQPAAFTDGAIVGTDGGPGLIDPTTDQLFAIDSGAFGFQALPNLWYLNAGVTIPISDYLLNLSQALSGVKAAKRSAELQEKAARVNAAANARLAYYDWVRARLRVEEAHQAIERAKVQLKLLEDMSRVGRAARADVLRQDAQLSQIELGLRRANTQETIAREQLFVMMNGGTGDPPKWEVGEDVTREQPGDRATVADLDRLQQEAIEGRLEIQALDETEYALEQQKYVDTTKGLPRVEGFGNLTYANPNQRYFPQENEWNGSWDVGVRAVWTLNDLGSNSSEAAVTRSEIGKVRAQKQQIKDTLRTELLSAHRAMEEAHLARDSAARGLESAEVSYEDRVRLFKAGKGTPFDVVDAETALVTARIDLVDTHIALRKARVHFDHALGRDVDDVVGSPKKRAN